MRVTFPHMGNLYICIKVLMEELGIDYIIPPFNSKATLETGTRYVPEGACLPLKITLGSLMHSCNLGIDAILMAGGRGPCRFGYYCEMYREIFKDLGFNIDIIALEPPQECFFEFYKKIKNLLGGFNLYKIIRGVTKATRASIKVDKIEKMVLRIRPLELEKGVTSKIYKDFKKDVIKANNTKEVFKLIEKTKNNLHEVKIQKDFKPLKVGIVGEIYTTIDDYTNFNILSRLGDMGVEADRYVTISNWITDHIIKAALKIPVDVSYAKAAKPYLGKMIGGHARETIGNTILYAQQGYDGVIQIYPLTCMPEIVAESILRAVERDFGIPILTLVIDEMTGEAGYITRIEAFVDLLMRRRERKAVGERYILSGN
jgi:predicted nucleotide-binding protein (sugar kinase/HSP70/actin superfamily)